MRFIDTNLFIRYFTRDDEEKAQKVLALLKRVERDKERITLSELNGGKQKGTITKWVPIRILIKRLSFFKHLWGKEFDFSEFRIKRYKPQQEARIQIKNIRVNIESIGKGTQGFPIRDVTKHLLSLIILE